MPDIPARRREPGLDPDRFVQAIADLDGYIDRKATELATERIEQADDLASDRVAATVARLHEDLATARAEQQRATDLAAELRRRLDVRERNYDGWQKRLGAALGLTPPFPHLSALIDEAETRLRRTGDA